MLNFLPLASNLCLHTTSKGCGSIPMLTKAEGLKEFPAVRKIASAISEEEGFFATYPSVARYILTTYEIPQRQATKS